MKKITYLLSLLILSNFAVFSQTSIVSGKITEKDAQTPIPGVNVLLCSVNDTTKLLVEVTDARGIFSFNIANKGLFKLKTSMLGYTNFAKTIRVKNAMMNLGTIALQDNITEIGAVEVHGYVPPAVQKGDSVEMRADAVKVNKDASAEDLVKKMPGITTENGAIKSQGEEIKKILVDGKTFFGDDASLALKNLPAEVIDKVQVFNKLSDQAQFTGFDDGNSVRTLNIITKTNKRNGWFGKFYGGGDFNSKYLAGTNLNYFNGDQKLSIVGLSNNINQQNFGSQNLFGSGGGMDNFSPGSQSGITKTNSIGLNYSGTLGSKATISGSYFFNNSKTKSINDKFREYYPSDSITKSYNDHNETNTNNINHRVNFRIEYNIDSVNAIIISPRASFQTNKSTVNLIDTTFFRDGLNNTLKQQSNNTNSGYSASSDFLYRHKFALAGRSVSLSVTPSVNVKESDQTNQNIRNSISENQEINNHTNGQSISSRLAYTEPIGKKGILQFNYTYNLTQSKINKETDSLDQNFNLVKKDEALSNKYQSDYTTHRPGVSYRYKNEKLNAAFGVDYQFANLDGTNLLKNNDIHVNKQFSNILPNLMITYKITQKTNLRINYRSNTNAPSVAQLQDITDNSNPVFLTKGNPNLKQEYSHNTFMRFSSADAEKATNTFIMIGGSYTLNPIGTKTITAPTNNYLSEFNEVLKTRGTQISRPENLDYSWNIRSMASYGFPIPLIKSNLNIFSGYSFSQSPGYSGAILNRSNSHNINNGITLSSNISQDVDFTVSYNSNLTISKNTAQIAGQQNNRYWNQSTGVSFNWVIWNGIVLRNDVTGQFNKGLSSASYNLNYTLWNASIGKKLFKNESGEIKLSVYDILNQNKSISHSVNSQYTEDTRTNILKQYVMLTFTYNLRSFGQKSSENPSRDFDGPHGPPPGGGRFMGPPPGGGGNRPPMGPN